MMLEGFRAPQLGMLSSVIQLRWVRFALIALGAIAIIYSFWPTEHGYIFANNPKQAWNDLETIGNGTLGVSVSLQNTRERRSQDYSLERSSRLTYQVAQTRATTLY